MNGTELKLRRTAAHAKAKDLAEILGWSASKISRVEQRAFVEPKDADAYVAALATFTTKTTAGAA